MKIVLKDKGNFSSIHAAALFLDRQLQQKIANYEIHYPHPTKKGTQTISKSRPMFIY